MPSPAVSLGFNIKELLTNSNPEPVLGSVPTAGLAANGQQLCEGGELEFRPPGAVNPLGLVNMN